MFEKVAFTMFQVVDAARARAFYEDVLGFERGLASPDGAWTEYDLPGGGCLALFMHPAPGAARSGGSASVAFEVADLDALDERLKAAGVHYTSDRIHGPNCRMSNIVDTEGNGIILHQLTKKKTAAAPAKKAQKAQPKAKAKPPKVKPATPKRAKSKAAKRR